MCDNHFNNKYRSLNLLRVNVLIKCSLWGMPWKEMWGDGNVQKKEIWYSKYLLRQSFNKLKKGCSSFFKCASCKNIFAEQKEFVLKYFFGLFNSNKWINILGSSCRLTLLLRKGHSSTSCCNPLLEERRIEKRNNKNYFSFPKIWTQILLLNSLIITN